MARHCGQYPPSTNRSPACGVWPFLLPSTDPFHPACVYHDNAYDYVDWSVGTKEIDYIFLDKMLEIAGTDKYLRKRAYLFFTVARNWGKGRYLLAKYFNIKPKGTVSCQRKSPGTIPGSESQDS